MVSGEEIQGSSRRQKSPPEDLAEKLFCNNGGSSDLRDIDAIILFKNVFLSELDLLRKLKSSDADTEVPKIRFNEQTCAQVLFGERNASIDRTVTQVLAVKWLLDGSKDKFKRYCLNLGDYQYVALEEHCKATLKDSSDVLILLVLTVSISLVKYGVLPDTSNFEGKRMSHETIAYEAARQSSMSSVQELQEDQRRELLECLRLASSWNLIQLITAELVPGNLAVFRAANDSTLVSKAIDICFIFSVIVGQQGQPRIGSAFSRLLTAQQQVKILATGHDNLTCRQAYNNILAMGGRELELKGFRHLCLNDPEERSLLRLVLMGHSASRSRAEWFARAFYGLPKEQRARLVTGLDAYGDGDEVAVTPSGMHALFEAGLKQRRGSVATLVNALESLMRFLIRIFENAKVPPGRESNIVECKVEFALETVRSEAFENDPAILDDLEIPLDVDGEDVRGVSTHDLSASEVSRHTSNVSVESDTGLSPSESTANIPRLINVKTCRECSGDFTYEHPDGDINIICGVPGDVKYKAISYVWGKITQVTVRCVGCGGASEIPMESQAKFEQLMNVVGGGSAVWLDAISINQQDPRDIATQVAVMGDIYSKADCVSVVLPTSDKEAFQLLENLLGNAEDIRTSMWLFTQSDRGPEHESIGRICQSFFANLSAMSRGQTQWLYWQRAWTFQEWALASGLEIQCEGLSAGTPKLTDVKGKILSTAFFLARYKLGAHQYSSVDIGFSRGEVPNYLRVVKRLFPREDIFLSNEEINQDELFIQTIFPHGDINQLLGIRGPHQAPGFRSRLSLMLDAFGTNNRQARFEADLICCWASMCNIKYAYDKHDSRAVALQKVLAALRREGLRIYNFHINTGARLEVDLHFTDYAMAHQLCNSSNKAFLPASPIYSGQTDTVFHLLHTLKQPDELASLEGNAIALRPIVKSPFAVVVELSDEVAVAQQMGRLIQGQLDDVVGFVYSNILINILQTLQGLPRSQLDKFVLIVVDIPIISTLPWKNGSQSGIRRLVAWAICPRNLAWPHSSLKVAREGLNGTLVLARSSEGMPLQAVAYLTITHAQCGSYLLVADEEGLIEIDFVTLKRSDIMITVNGGFPQEGMSVRVGFEDETIESIPGTSDSKN
ncbi:hypothetical protein VTL71DRAFT_1238 [Oculimacula yallundae]|uniref:Heterokaryon incompatibility domain-containing protein n=1 Tax=Oculimacula yallundae TaxID=86028 RepID=A0ABR4CC85_9HELO